jgi:glucose/arabinose dehydrogenase
MIRARIAAFALAGSFGLAATAPAWACPATLRTVNIVSGLTRPVWVTAAPGDDERIFVLEKNVSTTGRIRIIENINGAPTLRATPFLSISPVSTGNEQGLLGMAFHPNYASNGYFYVNFTDSSAGTVIRRYTAIPGPGGSYLTSVAADATSAFQITRIAQPFSNHNGGWIAFGPDGYLYIGMGDGGSAGDPGNRAQNLNDLLGKMLRIDVNGDDFPADPANNYAIPADNPFAGAIPGRDEIWTYGLRNHWRNDFDNKTGDLYIADVGQNNIEEVNFEPAGSPGGFNYGWRCYEGTAAFSLGGCPPASTMVFPIVQYTHSQGCSVTGGVVYRGKNIPGLSGTYFYADYCSNIIWSLRYRNGTVTEFTTRQAELAPGFPESITAITSFGEDNQGRMYIVEDGGQIWRVETSGTPAVGDANGDGLLNFDDINCFVAAVISYEAWRSCTSPSVNQSYTSFLCRNDMDRDGDVDFDDITGFVLALIGG